MWHTKGLDVQVSKWKKKLYLCFFKLWKETRDRVTRVPIRGAAVGASEANVQGRTIESQKNVQICEKITILYSYDAYKSEGAKNQWKGH